MLRKTLDFLRECHVFYVATMDGDQPRVRPFGVVVEHDNRLYFATANTKLLYRQIQVNPRIEICGAKPNGTEWIRVTAKAVFEPNPEAKKKAFESAPELAAIYQTPENEIFEVFYLANAEVVFFSMTAPAESGRF
ncbi:MAG: pyridoxamine 5'-phosphate oxidase family protein [Verrucomicrobiota bacterium]|jgi:uncharacterized pyridoxamine 5'-phosphate oxidase family protein|nr:pyridoxamine 5'-phosphate oxidase family protein [Verrucomicrobiota bacterium]